MIEDNRFIVTGYTALEPLPNKSLGRLFYDYLKENSDDSPAITDATISKTLTYNTVFDQSCDLARSLRKIGCDQNTVIAICSENCAEFVIAALAGLFIAAPVTTINQNYTKSEFIHTLNITRPKIIFCSEAVCEKLLELKHKLLRYIQRIIIIDSDIKIRYADNLSSFIKRHQHENKEDPYNFEPTEVDVDNSVAFVLYSSGTTGLPKGVMLTHKNVMVKLVHSRDSRFVDRNVKNTILCVLPFFHAYGLFMNLFNLTKHNHLITLRRFDEKLFLQSIQQYKITELTIVPPIAVFLSKSPSLNNYDLSSIQQVYCGAAPLSKHAEEKLKERFNIPGVRQGYGLTESTLGVTGAAITEVKYGSCGKLLPYVSCKVRDPESGRSLGPKIVGELCLKGPLVMKGYYGNEEATRNSFTSDGFLLTGDMGYYDDNGYFYIVDRLKELIKYKGFQVAPAELEALLLTNPKILDAGVVGLPNEEAGELPVAFVVKAPNASLTEEEVKKFVEKNVSTPKRLRGGVIFIKSIPKNPSGKILRRELRELLSKKYRSKL